jgi:hypothetical protein
MKYATLLCIGIFFIYACGTHEDSDLEFLRNYFDYCGYAYEGRSVMVDLGDDHPLDGADLLMILDHCKEHEVRIPFYVNEDRSRTWILRRTDRGLHLSHDHRYEDGTPYEQNLYGGYSDGRGTALQQFFPADERTIEERPARAINVWENEFDRENERYYYRLYLAGELRYEAEFDLSRPISLNDERIQ